MVMVHLFYNAGYSCGIAHCNFQLRGEDSESDEAFVRMLGSEFEMPVFVERFDTERIAKDKGISLQMAARKLRYDWFDSLLNRQDFDAIATAHNLNDSIETYLINMTRGTGIRGLSGIPVANKKVIRPLLFASKKEILAFSKENHISYREDASNSSKKYHRNRIRHDVIPALEEINPNFLYTMQENMDRNREAAQIFEQKVEETRQNIFRQIDNRFEIKISEILELNPLSTWLFELFSKFGFTRLQCADLEKFLYSSSGKQFISTSHSLYKDREKLFLSKLETTTFERYYLDKPGSMAHLPFPMDLEELSHDELDKIPADPNIAYLDFDKIQFPLTIRHWLYGDYFVPLGMDQLKKVSDFFIDLKVPVPLKNQAWILASGKNIVWIMGMRIDDRYKISPETKRILKLRIYDGDSSL